MFLLRCAYSSARLSAHARLQCQPHTASSLSCNAIYVQSDLKTRLDEQEQRAARLTERNRQLESRRVCDMSGWLSDVTLLRKQIAAVDRKLKQVGHAM